MIDTGLQVLDLAWYLMGKPKPLSVFAVMPKRLAPQAAAEGTVFDVEEAASVLVRFEGDKSLELSTSWAINQAPLQQGTLCRLHGDKGALEVYVEQGSFAGAFHIEYRDGERFPHLERIEGKPDLLGDILRPRAVSR